uniref:Uncharacterized protein n=1 Tax=Streptomyces sp. NBC_00003 TaxID=2903608 RepID=A0AAU2V6Z7_9ACTN
MSSHLTVEQVADDLARAYDGQPLSGLDRERQLRHRTAAEQLVGVPYAAHHRNAEAIRALAYYSELDAEALTVLLVGILERPAYLDVPEDLPPTPRYLRRRLVERLAHLWPQEHPNFINSVAVEALGVLHPVRQLLEDEVVALLHRIGLADAQRDLARRTAVTLEQTVAEAERLLRSGDAEAALGVLRGEAAGERR